MAAILVLTSLHVDAATYIHVKKPQIKSSLKVELRRYFTLIIFREIAQRVHANPSNDNFRPHGKH